LLRAERLHDIVVGAELEAGDPVDLVAAGGEDHDRDGRVAAKRPDDVEPVDLGQPEVEDDRIGAAGAGERETPGAIAGGQDAEPGVLEVVADEARDLRLVFDDEDGLHRLEPRRWRGAGRALPTGAAWGIVNATRPAGPAVTTAGSSRCG